MHPWHDLSAGDNVPHTIHVVVEIPKGSRNKYELDKETGVYHLSRVLYSPMIYPGDYGFVPRSYYEDGDPLDAIVLINEPTFIGCVIEARPVAIFKMLDKGEPDDKLLCVPVHNPFFNHITDLKHVPPHFLREVAHFFAVYKDLEGQRTLALGWEDATEARARIEHAVDLYSKTMEALPGWSMSETAQRRERTLAQAAQAVAAAASSGARAARSRSAARPAVDPDAKRRTAAKRKK